MKPVSFFTKTIIAINVIIMMNIMVASAQIIWITGHIFEKVNNEAVAIPFATVYLCDINDTDKVEYFGFTDLSGMYDLGDKVIVKSYFVKIEAPGYKSRVKAMGNLPKSFENNYTIHFELEADNKLSVKEATVYMPEDLTTQKANLLELLCMVPEIRKDDAGNILTSDGGSVKLLVNGEGVRLNSLSDLASTPYSAKQIEYYDLSDRDDIYQGVVNLVLTEGNQAKLDFTPYETKEHDLK